MVRWPKGRGSDEPFFIGYKAWHPRSKGGQKRAHEGPIYAPATWMREIHGQPCPWEWGLRAGEMFFFYASGGGCTSSPRHAKMQG